MFRKISLNDRDWMNRCRADGGNSMTVLSFPAVYTWQSAFGLTVDGDGDYYIIKSEADHGFYYPAGSQDACRKRVLSMIDEGGPLKLIYVPERELPWLESLGFEISCDMDTSEYVYSSHSLALGDYGSGTNYRVKIRHFSRDNIWTCGIFSFPEDEEMLRDMVSEWEYQVHGVNDSERSAVLFAAEAPSEIGLSGIHVETQDGEWAFLLGYESTPEIYDMSIVKYSPDISRNVVPVCICEMAKHVCDTYPYINLEDDMGIMGLRNMKRLYHPVMLLNSYRAFLRRDS